MTRRGALLPVALLTSLVYPGCIPRPKALSLASETREDKANALRAEHTVGPKQPEALMCEPRKGVCFGMLALVNPCAARGPPNSSKPQLV